MSIYQKSIEYHRRKPYGKLGISVNKPMVTQEDLMLAYSPGVAEPCKYIQENPLEADYLTSRSHLVGVISNGTAVLGLGNIGALASKPVMEGKAALLKKFAGLDAFDIEVDEQDADKFIDVVQRLEPTFGAINLEDIKAPECFIIEKALSEKMKIPVFHDDQHGTAIIVGAAITNALHLINKLIENVKLVCSGAGAAAIACLNLLVQLGLKKENIILFDSKGLVHTSSPGLNEFKSAYASHNSSLTLENALDGADIFLGLSAAGILKQSMLKKMAKDPIVLALANPEPEIQPKEAQEIRPDVIVATGRSDYPNQVNNVLGFPYIFRGALDVGATAVNWEMKLAAMHAIAQVAREENSSIVSAAYGGEIHKFGPEFIIPKPFDPRLFVKVSYAVAKAAVETGVATRPFESEQAWEDYRNELEDFIYHSKKVMKPIFQHLKTYTPGDRLKKKVVFAEGENWHVLQAAQMLVDEQLVKPVLIGRPDIVQSRVAQLGLRYSLESDVEIVDPSNDPRFKAYWSTYYNLMARSGITPELAKFFVRTQPTIIGALMMHMEDADAMVCGTVGRYRKHFEHIEPIIGSKNSICASTSILVLEDEPIFIGDTHLHANPGVEELCSIAQLIIKQVEAFGLTPKVALLSHSDFGSECDINAEKMRRTCQELQKRMPNISIEGEMTPGLAWDPKRLNKAFPESKLKSRANIWIAPNVEAGHMTFYTAKHLGGYTSIGPLLLGLKKPVHITTPAVSVRGLFDYACIAIENLHQK